MDIELATKMLMSSEGKTLNCSTQQKVTSYTDEGTWFVLIESEMDDGTLDRMQLSMERFERTYAKQHFAESGPIDPVVEDDEPEEVEAEL